MARTTELALDERCEPIDDMARLAAERQGAVFWHDQLRFVDAQIAGPEEWMKLRASLDSMRAPWDARTKARRESLYTRRPRLRPTRADSLRELADSLDHAELHSRMQHRLQQTSLAFQRCRDRVVRRAGMPPLGAVLR